MSVDDDVGPRAMHVRAVRMAHQRQHRRMGRTRRDVVNLRTAIRAARPHDARDSRARAKHAQRCVRHASHVEIRGVFDFARQNDRLPGAPRRRKPCRHAPDRHDLERALAAFALPGLWREGNAGTGQQRSHRRAIGELLRNARVWTETNPARADLTKNPPDSTGALSEALVRCRYVSSAAHGTTAKFDCVLPDGEVVKVKYGHTGEIHAEVAATRLLSALGFGADRMFLIPRLRCYGCLRNPFYAVVALDYVRAKRIA